MPTRRLKLIPEAHVPTDIDVQFAQCRSIGHEWRHRGLVTDEDARRPFGAQSGMVGYRSQCADCKTLRTKWITRSGQLGGTRYEYPDGYSRHGEDRIAPQQWRESWVTLLLVDFDATSAVQDKRKRARA